VLFDIGGLDIKTHTTHITHTHTYVHVCVCVMCFIQGKSLARSPKLFSMYTVEQRGFRKQVHLKHARRHFERNLVKDVHHRSVTSRNWLKT